MSKHGISVFMQRSKRCGYEIKELAGKISFQEAAYLLWNNKLPNPQELNGLKKKLASERKFGHESGRKAPFL